MNKKRQKGYNKSRNKETADYIYFKSVVSFLHSLTWELIILNGINKVQEA